LAAANKGRVAMTPAKARCLLQAGCQSVRSITDYMHILCP
jgi:hypothetical protein